jgi:hypothetical protein
MELEINVLSQASQAEKDTYCMISLLSGSVKVYHIVDLMEAIRGMVVTRG